MIFRSKFGNSSIYMKDCFEVHETEILAEGITKPFTIFVYSDIHLAFTDRRDDLGRRNFVMQRRIFFPGAPDVMEQAVVFNKNNPHDFTVLTGDIIDFPSERNFEVLECLREDGFGPYLYHTGNHDENFPYEKCTQEVRYGYRRRIDSFALDRLGIYPEVTSPECKDPVNNFHAVDLGEFIICGGDNVYKEGVEGLKKGLFALSSAGKPVFLCVHLPFHSEGLVDDVTKAWGRYTPRYFDEYLSLCENVTGILSGDVHLFNNNIVAGRIPQVVSTSTENKIRVFDYGEWPFYYSAMSIVKILPYKD